MPTRDALLTSRARSLREQATGVEHKLWAKLRARQLMGAKFVRQFPAAGYIADFACREHMLIVELDGSQHFESAYDDVRTKALEAQSYTVLRFWNRDVIDNLEGVIGAIEAALLLAVQRWEERHKAGIGERAADD
ncbi:endonuclease domain-containing protein [Sphingoaurantiacus capsulatus]|uniref:Endonuclease domain-containing protein n=1 Tax=Sphingoaurantiacus capsulatus TaxID=1771310 RepID=A0ABV7XCJ5_9SPHN